MRRKPFKPAGPKRFSRRSLFLINFVLFMIPVTYFGYPFLLRWSASIIITDEQPKPSDALLVLGGGEPGRVWEAADLFNAKLAPYVVVTRGQSTMDMRELLKLGVEWVDGRGNYIRVLRGLGVPEDRIVTLEPPVEDTLAELQQFRALAGKRNWKSFIIVTSNYHTRRARMAAGYVFGPDLQFSVVGSKHGGLDRKAWWKNRGDVRTFLIEFEKLVAYTLYIGPRILWTSRSDTSQPNSSSALPDFSSMS